VSKEKIDDLLMTSALLCLGLAIMKLGTESDRHKARLDAVENKETWQNAELARLHRNQDELAHVVFTPAGEELRNEAPAKKPVGRPRKTTVAKKTTTARKKVAV